MMTGKKTDSDDRAKYIVIDDDIYAGEMFEYIYHTSDEAYKMAKNIFSEKDVKNNIGDSVFIKKIPGELLEEYENGNVNIFDVVKYDTDIFIDNNLIPKDDTIFIDENDGHYTAEFNVYHNKNMDHEVVNIEMNGNSSMECFKKFGKHVRKVVIDLIKNNANGYMFPRTYDFGGYEFETINVVDILHGRD